MASQVDIANRALQHLGANSIVSLTENSKSAREMNRALIPVIERELEAHPWNFAKTRAILPPSSEAPAFGYTTMYQLPVDCIKPLRNIDSPDWQHEGDSLLLNQSGDLPLRYIRRVLDANAMTPLFREYIAVVLASDLAETFTQSKSKKEEISGKLIDIRRTARKRNAFSNPALEFAPSTWVTDRE